MTDSEEEAQVEPGRTATMAYCKLRVKQPLGQTRREISNMNYVPDACDLDLPQVTLDVPKQQRRIIK